MFADAKAPRFVLWGNKLRPVPSSPLTLLKTDLLSTRGKARAVFGALGLKPRAPGAESCCPLGALEISRLGARIGFHRGWRCLLPLKLHWPFFCRVGLPILSGDDADNKGHYGLPGVPAADGCTLKQESLADRADRATFKHAPSQSDTLPTTGSQPGSAQGMRSLWNSS